MRIYVASSWRNHDQPAVVRRLRAAGHEVYDFRHPAEGNDGFSWRSIDPNWERWTPDALRRGLQHATAEEGFNFDMSALRWCEACVLVQPCGRSAHLELGWAVGAGKRTIVYLADGCEPELMYKMCAHMATTLDEVCGFLG
jgi:hypothetical protein